MTSRSSIENCTKIIQKLGFRKGDSGGLVGLLLKSILARDTLKANGAEPSIFDEFRYLTQSEIVKVLETGAELWMILKKIYQTGCNRSNADAQSNYLRNQFESAHEFLVNKIRHHSSENKDIFESVLIALQASTKMKKGQKNLNTKKVEPLGDGLSSQ